MDSDFYSDEGVLFSNEDVTAFISFLVPSLVDQGCSYGDIIEYYESAIWREQAILFLCRDKKNKKNERLL